MPHLAEFTGFFLGIWQGEKHSILQLGYKGLDVITNALDLSNLLQRDQLAGGYKYADGRYVKEEKKYGL